MLEQQRGATTKKQTTLYRVVFESTAVKCAVFVLFGFLILQPLSPALASFEEETTNTADTFISPAFEAPEVLDEPVVEEAPVVNEVIENEVLEVQDVSVASEEEVVTGFSDPEVVEPELQSETQEATSTEPIDEEISDEEATTTDDTTVTATTSEEVVVEEEVEVVDSPVATSTDPVYGRPTAAFEFDTKECTSVGDGAYYCSTPQENSDPMEDGVFALPDEGGDLEIFVRVGGKENKLTDNTVDDSAPYFDAISKRIVWHTSLNDRYQIISYDTETTDKILLTKTSYNNMEPVAHGDITLWQAWIGNNWEIMMYDGQAVVQLTNNTLQDVSPHMREGYVVWQTQFQDGWKVAVYDLKTKAIEYIDSEGGLKVENPRFVLVYDSTNEQGDVQTVGYDLNTKQSFSLGSLPAELPEELPEPDQTGETRALIQNKQSSREGENEVVDGPVPQGGAGTSTATSSPHTLDLSSGSTTVSTLGSSTPATVDIVIPSYTASTSEGQHNILIPDLVIPPVTATSTE
jgi:hypothetical protein